MVLNTILLYYFQLTYRRCYNNRGRHPETPGPAEFSIPPKKGKMFDKKPFPMVLEAGKKFAWCTCGESHQQVSTGI
jgi:hypothetical protein